MCCSKPRPRKSPVSVSAEVLCATCSALDIQSMLRDGLARERMAPLGPLTVILKKSELCLLCRLIGTLLRRCWRLDDHPDVDLSSIECSIYATSCGALEDPDLEEKKQTHRLRVHTSDRPQEIYNAMTVARMGMKLDIQLLEEDVHRVSRAKGLHGRRMSDGVDMALVKRWVTLCEKEHGDTCELVWWRRNDENLPSAVRMVDVTLMSVVQAPSSCRYVALSYVWGGPGEDYWTTMANINTRSSPAGLDGSILPATILDSIHLAQQMQERYLWVDALCIIQDSPDDKAVQIHVMDLIYSKAAFTIFAAGEEAARARLPGFLPGTRSCDQQIGVVQGLHLALPLPSLRETLAQSIWDTRGWTFQELILSRRRLFFTKHQAYFECAKDVWCEDLIAESKTLRYSDHPMRYLGSGSFLRKPPTFPNPDYTTSYATAVGQYLQRQLSHESDIVDAITALTNAITKGYQLVGGDMHKAFRYGMQIRDLDHSLLWQPRIDSVHIRRIASDMAGSPWPSWAWAGWKGAVAYIDESQLISTTITPNIHPQPLVSLVTPWRIVDHNGQIIQLDVEPIRPSQIIVDSGAAEPPVQRYIPPENQMQCDQFDPPPPAGTLIFLTQWARFEVSRVKNSELQGIGTPNEVFRIVSHARSPSACVGRIILPTLTPSSTILDFIVLSRCGGMIGLYDEHIYGQWYFGCILHVMAVRNAHDPRLRERVGVGVMFEGAWLESSPEETVVLLA
ncbi:hypothetical protein HYDPIDRAFT_90096 [Hydnomerulius pinastri MD-312]|uniref:Heterokaryon incompatibility domain-containing protein n=1 Tax=Hydnomerulius pinastri MD-312 TaxID=994086 RepID=A0A0C9W160_9AGAM|nr:hypothetical protein HYDPIDRAFT_90096 [Hydnomerulius pinastri MD-312]